MSNTLNKTVIQEGTQKALVHFYIESDGSSDFVLEPFFDPVADFDLPQVATMGPNGVKQLPRIAVNRVWFHLNGIVCTFIWDGSPGFPGLILAPGDTCHADYSCFGGIKDFTVNYKNESLVGTPTVAGTAGSATDFGGTIPANASLDPKAIMYGTGAYPEVVPQQVPFSNAKNPLNVPQQGTGKLLLTTQGMTVPGLQGGGVANGMLIMEFKKYVG